MSRLCLSIGPNIPAFLSMLQFVPSQRHCVEVQPHSQNCSNSNELTVYKGHVN